VCFINLLVFPDTLKSYGFRGEALSSICCVAEVSIITKTDDDAVASTYKFDSNGEIVDKAASHLNQGFFKVFNKTKYPKS